MDKALGGNSLSFRRIYEININFKPVDLVFNINLAFISIYVSKSPRYVFLGDSTHLVSALSWDVFLIVIWLADSTRL